MLKVKRAFYDRYTPSVAYEINSYIEVEDIERRKDIIKRELAVECDDEVEEAEVKILKKLKEKTNSSENPAKTEKENTAKTEQKKPVKNQKDK